jgi:hypothetical protein
LVLFRPPIPAPATVRPTIDLASVQTPLPSATIQPTFDAGAAGSAYNPYFSADMAGMTALTIDVLDVATGTYTRAIQLTGTQMDPFVEALNVSVFTTAPDLACPNHVRFTVTRADNSNIVFGACLKDVVILRGDALTDLRGADAPMYPGFTEALAPYLPQNLKDLLSF